MISTSNAKGLPKPEGSMWSDDQWRAISESGNNMLVAAAAGSGKTAVLVERIIRKIVDSQLGFSVDRLLVATFTKAAAAEMRQRIREALERVLEQEPESEHVRRQLSLLNRASITTLHSFCMEVIRRHYQAIPLDPGFRIMNEHETELLRQELLEELFEEKYELHDEGSTFRRLVDWFSGERTDDAMYVLVQRLYDFSQSHPWPEHWLRETAAAFRVQDVVALGETPWVRSILTDAALSLRGAASLLEQAHETAMQPGGPAPYAMTLQEDTAMVKELLQELETQPWASLYDQFQAASFGKLKPVKKDQTEPALQERVKTLREAAKKMITDMKASLFGRRAEAYLEELHATAPLMDELVETVIAFGERFQQHKQSKGLVDFGDLEHYCLKILRHPDSTPYKLLPSDAALEYKAQFDEVLLDEYQDTNTVQEDIVRLVSREEPGNRFMVGDVKQSIYRFRLAEPGLFLNKYQRYGMQEQEDGFLIDLARNFRSREEVVDAVNLVFRQIMSVDVAEIEYDERAWLVHGASYPEKTEQDATSAYAPELLLVDKGGRGLSEVSELSETGDESALQESELAELAELETAQLEARAIAQRIKELTGDTGQPLLIYDRGLKAMRPAVYGDIVILLRSASVWAPLIVEELRLEGIPASGEQTTGFFKATEVEVMLSLLHIIDNPQQDIPLASVLRSPIVGLTEDELAQIRLEKPDGMFYDALLAAAQTEQVEESLKETSADVMEMDLFTEDPLSSPDPVHRNDGNTLSTRLRSFLRNLDAWRQEARQGSLSVLIWNVLEETGYLDWVGGLPGGSQRQSNLRALYDRARQYETSTSNRGLFRFLTFISRLRERGGDLGSISGGTEPDQAVRIMTIHKSKGLEFPVVFIAGTAKMFNQQDLNAPFLMHKELGFGPKYVEEQNRVSYPTLPNLAIRRRSQLELLAEEMRVLYVALTRPREKLIMTGTVKDLASRAAGWARAKEHAETVLPDYMLAAGRSYLDWVGPALIRHPSATSLREAAGDQEGYYHRLEHMPGADWLFKIVASETLSGSRVNSDRGEEVSAEERQKKTEALRNVELIELDEESETDIAAALSWTYPYERAGKTAANTSVTEMKRWLEMQEIESDDWLNLSSISQQSDLPEDREDSDTRGSQLHLRRPKFMGNQRLTPTERGTVYHTLMLHVPLDGVMSAEVIEETKARLLNQRILLDVHAKALDTNKILRFFSSELGERMLGSSRIQRELPFTYTMRATDYWNHSLPAVLPEQKTVTESGQDDKVLMNGIIDCLFETPEGLVLLDYKTDRITEYRTLSHLTDQYRFQLELYARVIKEITGKKVAEKWLYFIEAGESVQL
ncbi:helicase-exonuclease AddAB subunit AddA [Paenibacillus polymyxa]|uniref:helicase-exonuclease AddAB subunit AddA n=1 Tax=Paenibacillus TaxID=44249 RepID=UPI000F513062|nr:MULTISPECIES: helicase-exonuclease AddAB subunit AddA [Paenibacillus]KAF6659226.1 helicase-exonuclease AddAB subunit AddA [Paenibacillus sp. EKM301P]RPE01721.1 helicase-exonuclease AddAB subunit AddA [Paenibacillus polymyxa]UBS85763.1 helicase-exonuclease AddAB subunit AddA [Paenibacillus polymyxa]WHX34285.1 helicase-exonuclease AddAB subunit AddA [Paenibacillus polymyxa]